MNRILLAGLALAIATVPGAAQQTPAQRETGSIRIEKLAEAISAGTERIREEVLTAKGRVADALLSDQNESLYTRLDEAADELEDAAENLDPGLRGKVGLEGSVADKQARLIRQYRTVASLARAAETELSGGGFPAALEIYNTAVKPSLADLAKELPTLTATR